MTPQQLTHAKDGSRSRASTPALQMPHWSGRRPAAVPAQRHPARPAAATRSPPPLLPRVDANGCYTPQHMRRGTPQWSGHRGWRPAALSAPRALPPAHPARSIARGDLCVVRLLSNGHPLMIARTLQIDDQNTSAAIGAIHGDCNAAFSVCLFSTGSVGTLSLCCDFLQHRAAESLPACQHKLSSRPKPNETWLITRLVRIAGC